MANDSFDEKRKFALFTVAFGAFYSGTLKMKTILLRVNKKISLKLFENVLTLVRQVMSLIISRKEWRVKSSHSQWHFSGA